MCQETGYQKIQGTKPQTLGYGLHDSPVGLLAWLAEKFHGWSDLHGAAAAPGLAALEMAHPPDDLLTNVALYWFSGCITSSCRLYYESLGPLATGSAGGLWRERVAVPCGVALFAAEPFAATVRGWVERGYNVRRWQEFPHGGHFAAREQPAALLADLQAFVYTGDRGRCALLFAATLPAPAAAAAATAAAWVLMRLLLLLHRSDLSEAERPTVSAPTACL